MDRFKNYCYFVLAMCIPYSSRIGGSGPTAVHPGCDSRGEAGGDASPPLPEPGAFHSPKKIGAVVVESQKANRSETARADDEEAPIARNIASQHLDDPAGSDGGQTPIAEEKAFTQSTHQDAVGKGATSKPRDGKRGDDGHCEEPELRTLLGLMGKDVAEEIA